MTLTFRRPNFFARAQLGTYTNFVNLLDLCAVAVPAGARPGGVPFGLTVVAPAHHDYEAAALASVFTGESPSTATPAAADDITDTGGWRNYLGSATRAGRAPRGYRA